MCDALGSRLVPASPTCLVGPARTAHLLVPCARRDVRAAGRCAAGWHGSRHGQGDAAAWPGDGVARRRRGPATAWPGDGVARRRRGPAAPGAPGRAGCGRHTPALHAAHRLQPVRQVRNRCVSPPGTGYRRRSRARRRTPGLREASGRPAGAWAALLRQEPVDHRGELLGLGEQGEVAARVDVQAGVRDAACAMIRALTSGMIGSSSPATISVGCRISRRNGRLLQPAPASELVVVAAPGALAGCRCAAPPPPARGACASCRRRSPRRCCGRTRGRGGAAA